MTSDTNSCLLDESPMCVFSLHWECWVWILYKTSRLEQQDIHMMAAGAVSHVRKETCQWLNSIQIWQILLYTWHTIHRPLSNYFTATYSHTHQTQCQLNMPQMSAELAIYSTSNNVCVSISEERQGINTRRTQTRDRTQAKRWKVRHIQIWHSM